jgi:uncharacterized RDD family membrane protein YckC
MTDSELQQKRLIAAAIDIAVAVAISLVFVVMVWVFTLVGTRTSSVAMSYVVRVLGFVGALLGLGYVLARDVVAGGSSIGKKTQGLRVVTTSGAPAGLMESAKRNAFFAIGSLLGVLSATLGLVPCLGDVVNCLLTPLKVIGFLVALAVAVIEIVKIVQDPEGIRLGDGFAGTRVVRG